MGRAVELTIISDILGWSYFLCWSASFYPQAWLNWKRKSVVGLSFDYQLYNIIGYICYSVFTCSLLFNHAIRHEYNDAFSSNLVTPQDCFFALHGALLTAFQIGQIFIYDRGTQTFSNVSLISVAAILVLVLTYALAVLFVHTDKPSFHGVEMFSWLCWVYFLSFIKLGITVVKYIPQAKLNYDRKSTVGWNIHNVLLDISGGVLSMAQLLLDGATLGWDGVVGDPIKFGLSFVSIFFDILFIIQHYILYPEREAPEERSSKLSDGERLLDEETNSMDKPEPGDSQGKQ